MKHPADQRYATHITAVMRGNQTIRTVMESPSLPVPGVTIVVVADGDAVWLPYTLRSIAAQQAIGEVRVVVVADASLPADAIASATKQATTIVVPADEVRSRALIEARDAHTAFTGLTCATDYWHGPEKLARQTASLVDNPTAGASFHPVIMRWTDDLRVFPGPEWRRSGTVDAEDVLRAVPWTSLVVRTGAIREANPGDAACDFFGLRTMVGLAGLVFDEHPMAVRQMTMLQSPLPGSPLERLEMTHATKLEWRRPADHRLLGSPGTFVQDWLAAIESGLVLPAELGAAEWGSRGLAGQLHEERMAHARTAEALQVSRQRTAERDAAVADLSRQLAEAERHSQQVLSSRTWRSTEWLRRASRRRDRTD